MVKNTYELTAPKVAHNRDLTGSIPKNCDPNMIPDPREGFFLSIVASRGSGKSYLMYNLLSKWYKGCFDKVIIFNPSLGNDLTLSPESLSLPEDCFYDHIDTDVIKETIAEQVKEKKDYDSGNYKKKYLSRVLIVFTDCISDKAFTSNNNQNLLNMLAFKGRHLRISVILDSQSYTGGLSKRMRVNCPNWIFFKSENLKERKAMCEEIGGTCSEKGFTAMFDQATQEPYDFFFIYGTCPNKDWRFRRNIDNILLYEK